MRTKASGPLSNSAAQGQAREVREQLRTYVNLHYGYIQAEPGFENWRERSARVLTRATELLRDLRAADARTGLLPDVLQGSAFERARCLEVEGEHVVNARRRGTATECAGDLSEALRTGNLRLARELFRDLVGNMERLP